jgi:hypothetical protein
MLTPIFWEKPFVSVRTNCLNELSLKIILF